VNGRDVKAAYKTGDKVTVRALGKRGHIRTPDYVIGHTGTVVELCGYFLNPEDLSIGNVGGPAIPLYRIMFSRQTLWPDELQAADTTKVFIEIYEHWLEMHKNGETT
jgi:hypothetical protein